MHQAIYQENKKRQLDVQNFCQCGVPENGILYAALPALQKVFYLYCQENQAGKYTTIYLFIPPFIIKHLLKILSWLSNIIGVLYLIMHMHKMTIMGQVGKPPPESVEGSKRALCSPSLR